MSQSEQPASAAPGAPVLIPLGKTFTPGEITFFKDQGTRTLEQAMAEADVLVSCPHSGDAVPGGAGRIPGPRVHPPAAIRLLGPHHRSHRARLGAD